MMVVSSSGVTNVFKMKAGCGRMYMIFDAPSVKAFAGIDIDLLHPVT